MTFNELARQFSIIRLTGALEVKVFQTRHNTLKRIMSMTGTNKNVLTLVTS